MGTDKRTVATDALETLGTIIDERAGRDAIHLAVEPVVAGHRLHAGDHVGFLLDGRIGRCGNPVGIVDPFLEDPVHAGERFRLVVYPRQITSLRHVWTHPEFDAARPPTAIEAVDQKQQAAQDWLKEFAVEMSVDCDELMAHAKRYLLTGKRWIEGGRFEGMHVPDEFWDHYQTVTGEMIPVDKIGSFFSCSC